MQINVLNSIRISVINACKIHVVCVLHYNIVARIAAKQTRLVTPGELAGSKK